MAEKESVEFIIHDIELEISNAIVELPMEQKREVALRTAKILVGQVAVWAGALKPELFRFSFIEAIFKSIDLVLGIKNAGYNKGGVRVRDYYRFHGTGGIAFELHKKSLRAISITDPQNEEGKKLSEGVEDTAVDTISYGGFLYAESKCRAWENGNATN